MTTDPTATYEATKRLVEIISTLVVLTNEYREQRLTENLVRDQISFAKQFAAKEGVDLSGVDENYVVGLVKMQFTIVVPEEGWLDGDETGHIPWLEERIATLFNPGGFWDNYRRLLERDLPTPALRRLDEVTNRILGRLEDPNRSGQWDRRGLVMGHVQSGKTNNYCGLVAKAADAGYKVIIILAGTYNNLRSQTQQRIDRSIIGRDTSQGPASVTRVGVGLGGRNPAILSLTSAIENGDFKASTAATVGFDFGAIKEPTIFVIKKNVKVLENLHNWILTNAPIPEGHERVAGIPLLLIDDEADSASINTADTVKDPETDPTKTNMGVRRILNTFDQASYVGYTATPFANIFIDDSVVNDEVGEDLFPRSFIFSLEAPSNWVGPEQIFGLDGSVEEDLEPLPLVGEVTDSEDWVPSRHRNVLQVREEKFPDSLKEAIDCFVLSCAARNLRGHQREHKSMLVHVTPWNLTQATVNEQIADRLFALKNEILYESNGPVRDRFELLWDTRFVPASESLQESDDPPPTHSYDEIEPYLGDAVGAIETRMINGLSSDLLDYAEHGRSGLSVIVVGGAKLSRGLTLEGLSVSYYLRATRMYDTLMQMGRWFGYRPQYLDLCRIYTTPEIIDSYRNITVATRELLDDFRQMEVEGKTPDDFRLKVRHSPGMLVTSQSKMRNGVKQRISYSGELPSSRIFATDEGTRRACWSAAERLVENLGDLGVTQPDRGSAPLLWDEVPSEAVIDYLKDLKKRNLYTDAGAAEPDHIQNYVRQRNNDGCLTSWTVALKTKSDAPPEHMANLGPFRLGVHERRPEGSSRSDLYRIKALISPTDERLGLNTDQIARAEDRWRDQNPDGATIPGRFYRYERFAGDGLLILYAIRPAGTDHKIPEGTPFLAYCFSLPVDAGGGSVEYIVRNSYEQRELFEI